MRRMISTAFLVSCCLAALALLAQDTAQQPQSPDRAMVSQQLIQREIEAWNHRRARDVSYFQNQIPGDFKADMSNGVTENKKDVLDRVQNYPLDTFNARDFNVSYPTPDTAVVTYTVDYSGKKPDGSQFSGTRQFQSDWRQRDGQWENVKVVERKQ